MAKDKKTRHEFIIDTLLSSKPLRGPEITRIISEAMGEEIRVQDVSSVLAKLANHEKCDLGYFMKREKTGRGLKFSLVSEIRELATDEIYALTRKSGQPRFTVKDAMRKVPRLRKYVTAAKRRPLKALDNESMANVGLNELLSVMLQELARQGGLKVNVNLTVYLKKTGR